MSQQMEASRAPSVDPAWTEAFVKEAQLHDVPSSVIDSTLLEVDVHVKRAGQSASELYGDPVEYAADLGESAMPANLSLLAAAIGPLLMQVLGGLMIAFTVFRSDNAGDIPITWGSMFAFALIAVLYITLASRTLCTWVMRGLMARPIVSIISVLVYLAATVYAATIPGIYFMMAPVVMIVLGSLLVGIGMIWGFVRARGERSESQEAAGAQGGMLLPYLVIPVIAAILLLISLVL